MATLTDVDAEAIRQRLVVKESLTQAFKELRAAEASGAELPDARKYSNNGGGKFSIEVQKFEGFQAL